MGDNVQSAFSFIGANASASAGQALSVFVVVHNIGNAGFSWSVHDLPDV